MDPKNLMVKIHWLHKNANKNEIVWKFPMNLTRLNYTDYIHITTLSKVLRL